MLVHDEVTFRDYERTLDEHHRTLPFWNVERERGVYGLLAAFDSYMLVDLLTTKPLDVPQAMLFKGNQEGLVWAFRWLGGNTPHIDVRPSGDVTLIESAGQFIEHARVYNHIALCHKEHGWGALDVLVDRENKVVRFAPDPTLLGRRPTWAYAEGVAADNRLMLKTRSTEWREILRAVQRTVKRISYRLVDGRIVIDPSTNLMTAPVMAMVDAEMEEHSLFPLQSDIGGFSLDDYRVFWRCLNAWSTIAMCLYFMLCNDGVVQDTCMPTQVLERDTFHEMIQRLTDLDVESIRNIISRLTFDNRTKNPDIFLQPLVCGPTLIAWSPHVVQLSRYQRNMLRLMARTPSLKTLADEIIEQRERPFLRDFGTFLCADTSWSFKLNTKTSYGAGFEVDFLGYNPKYPQEVLVIEGKTILPADDVNEALSATDVMIYGQKRVNRCISILRNMPNDIKQSLFRFVNWNKVTDYYGLVITPETDPCDTLDHCQIPAASFKTLRIRLNRRDRRRPRYLWEAVKARRWLEPFFNGAWYWTSFQIGEIRYELPCVKFSDGLEDLRS